MLCIHAQMSPPKQGCASAHLIHFAVPIVILSALEAKLVNKAEGNTFLIQELSQITPVMPKSNPILPSA